MLDFLKELSQARMDTLFVLAGLAFLAVAVFGNISGKIQPGKGGRIAAGILGPALIIVGLSMHIEGHTADGDGTERGESRSTGTTGGGGTSRDSARVNVPVSTPSTPNGDAGSHDAPPASVPVTSFSGRWRNIDSHTRGITTVEIDVSGNQASVHAWGACHPTDCDWGRVQASLYAPGVSSREVRSLGAVYTTSFSQTTLTLRLVAADSLEVESATHFTDQSGRSDYSAAYAFRPNP